MKRRLFFNFAVCCCILLQSSAYAAPAKDAAKKWNQQVGWLVLPIFFATDRQLDINSSDLNYKEEQMPDGLNYGVKNVVVPLEAHAAKQLSALTPLGWCRLPGEGKTPPPIKNLGQEQLKTPTRTMKKDEFVGSVEKAINESPRKEVLVYVHGCCADFKTSIERAARLAQWFKVPVVMYDWTSPVVRTWLPELNEYRKNEVTYEQSQDRFNEFLDSLEEKFGAQRITVAAHSLGNRFLDAAMKRRYDRFGQNPHHTKFNEVIYGCADVDARAFANHSGKAAWNGRINRIYASEKDSALATSRRLHGKEPRLGSPGPVLDALSKTQKLDVVDVTDVGMNHELPFWVMSNMHRYGRPGEKRDFDILQKNPHYYVLRQKNVPAPTWWDFFRTSVAGKSANPPR